ncbi:MAG: hypothetical protein ACSLEX_00600 [Minisyncoccota bacterium]
MQKLSFHTICQEAWKVSWQKKIHWIFALLIGIVSIISNTLSEHYVLLSGDTPPVIIPTQHSLSLWLLILCGLTILFIINVFGKGNLIASLAFIAGRKHITNYPNTRHNIWLNFRYTLLLEITLIGIFLMIIGTLSIPFLIAISSNPDVIPILALVSILTLLPILTVLFFLRQYALYYLLLSPLGFNAALEAGMTLFVRHSLHSLIFGFLTLLISFLFTFFLNLIILSISALTNALSLTFIETGIIMLIGWLALSWFSLFSQALWLSFFKHIAMNNSDPLTETSTKEEYAITDQVSEIPPLV